MVWDPPIATRSLRGLLKFNASSLRVPFLACRSSSESQAIADLWISSPSKAQHRQNCIFAIDVRETLLSRPMFSLGYRWCRSLEATGLSPGTRGSRPGAGLPFCRHCEERRDYSAKCRSLLRPLDVETVTSRKVKVTYLAMFSTGRALFGDS